MPKVTETEEPEVISSHENLHESWKEGLMCDLSDLLGTGWSEEEERGGGRWQRTIRATTVAQNSCQ
jgi:hypothetical protein